MTEANAMPYLLNSIRLTGFSTSCFQFWTDIETQPGVTDNEQEAHEIGTICQLMRMMGSSGVVPNFA